MLKGSEIKEKSIITINGQPFFVAFKTKTTNKKKTILIGLSVEEIIKDKHWPIKDSEYDILENYFIDESGISCDPKVSDCSCLTGIEKMKLQTILIKNKLSEIAAHIG